MIRRRCGAASCMPRRVPSGRPLGARAHAMHVLRSPIGKSGRSGDGRDGRSGSRCRQGATSGSHHRSLPDRCMVARVNGGRRHPDLHSGDGRGRATERCHRDRRCRGDDAAGDGSQARTLARGRPGRACAPVGPGCRHPDLRGRRPSGAATRRGAHGRNHRGAASAAAPQAAHDTHAWCSLAALLALGVGALLTGVALGNDARDIVRDVRWWGLYGVIVLAAFGATTRPAILRGLMIGMTIFAVRSSSRRSCPFSTGA